MIDRVRDIHDGLISVEDVADAAEHQKLVKRPPRDLRVNCLLNAKAAFLQKLKEGGFKEGVVEGVGDCMFIAPQAYHEIEHPEALDAATRDLKVTSLRNSIVEAVGAGKRTTSMVPLHVRQAIASYFGGAELRVRLRLTLSRPFVFIRPPPRRKVCVDVGANIGLYALYLLSKGCVVHAIELRGARGQRAAPPPLSAPQRRGASPARPPSRGHRR